MRKIWVYCKQEDCKKLVEKTAKNDYICSNCNTSLLDNTGSKKNVYINMNPFARQTKMEISYEDANDNVKRFK
mgnify:FL=1